MGIFSRLGIGLMTLTVLSACALASSNRIDVTAEGYGGASIDDLLLTMEDLSPALRQELFIESQISDVTDTEFLDIAEGANEFRLRQWGDNDGSRSLTQVIYGFPENALAKADYQAAPHGRNYHFVDGLEPVEIDISVIDLKADEANVYCANYGSGAKENYCSRWGFRGRYGRFVVDVLSRKYLDNHQFMKIRKDIFLDIVKKVDKLVGEKIAE